MTAAASRHKHHRELLSYHSPTSIWRLVFPHRWALLWAACISLITQGGRAAIPFSTKYLVDQIIGKHDFRLLPSFLMLVSLAVVIQAVGYFMVSQTLAAASEKLIADVRKQVNAHVLALPIGYFDSRLSGELSSRVMDDTESLRNLIGAGLVEFLGALFMALIALGVLAKSSMSLTCSVVGVQLIACAGLYRAFVSSRSLAQQQCSIRASVVGRLIESMSGIRTIKGYRAETRESVVFADGMARLLANALRSRFWVSTMFVTNILSYGIGSLLVMGIGAQYVIARTWTIGDFLQYSAMLVYLIGPTFQLVGLCDQFAQALGGLDRVRDTLTTDIEDPRRARSVELGVINGNVNVEHVSFGYEECSTVLHDITFSSNAGSVTAVVGSSGAGKSTLISLLSAFHAPRSGRITIDGIDLCDVTFDSYRRQLGLVLQDSFLFEGSIRENILFSRPDATEEMLVQACTIAHVNDFVSRLPNGYETIIGERGVRLSGGQRQRLSIARAILADPRILILDEATSSLDSESEALIQEGLRYLLRGRTTFVIAHRLSTIRRADQILVMACGRIVERGTHEELYRLRGRYFDLYTRQLGADADLFLAPFESDQAELG